MENGFELRKHMKLHSFKGTICGEYKCKECDFYGNTLETMEVHAGKCCNGNFYCGLFNIKIDSLEILKTHLVSCEVYECKECFERVKMFMIKTNKKYHLKMNRKRHEKFDICLW